MTFTLDTRAVRHLDQAAERLSIPKSQVVREALEVYHRHLGRLSEEERRRVLDTFDCVVPAIPDRTREEVEAELEEVSRARKESGRE